MEEIDTRQDATGDLKQEREVGDGTVRPTEEARDNLAETEKPVARTVMLRKERAGADLRSLWAHMDEEGRLHIDGQDLGSGTATISPDGEYEWFKTFAAEDVPRIVALLGGSPDEDALDVLERWSGKSYDLEALLRDSGIPFEFFSC